MNILKLPFNKYIGYIGLEITPDSNYLLMLNSKDEYLNHLSTIHASPLFALSEASSGFFLLEEFKDMENIIPVVRKVDTRYKNPANGAIYSKACFINTDKAKISEEVDMKRRALITVRVLLYDSQGNNVMQADFESFVAKTIVR